MTMSIKSIISGGQTGADKGGLEAARECGIKTGGTAPYKFKIESGFDETLKDYGLEECAVSSYSYRTELNVRNSDGTVIFMPTSSSGSLQTKMYCDKHKKPVIINPSNPQILAEWIAVHNISILNVAGNRESKFPGIKDIVKGFIIETIKLFQE